MDAQSNRDQPGCHQGLETGQAETHSPRRMAWWVEWGTGSTGLSVQWGQTQVFTALCQALRPAWVQAGLSTKPVAGTSAQPSWQQVHVPLPCRVRKKVCRGVSPHAKKRKGGQNQ